MGNGQGKGKRWVFASRAQPPLINCLVIKRCDLTRGSRRCPTQPMDGWAARFGVIRRSCNHAIKLLIMERLRLNLPQGPPSHCSIPLDTSASQPGSRPLCSPPLSDNGPPPPSPIQKPGLCNSNTRRYDWRHQAKNNIYI